MEQMYSKCIPAMEWLNTQDNLASILVPEMRSALNDRLQYIIFLHGPIDILISDAVPNINIENRELLFSYLVDMFAANFYHKDIENNKKMRDGENSPHIIDLVSWCTYYIKTDLKNDDLSKNIRTINHTGFDAFNLLHSRKNLLDLKLSLFKSDKKYKDDNAFMRLRDSDYTKNLYNRFITEMNDKQTRSKINSLVRLEYDIAEKPNEKNLKRVGVNRGLLSGLFG